MSHEIVWVCIVKEIGPTWCWSHLCWFYFFYFFGQNFLVGLCLLLWKCRCRNVTSVLENFVQPLPIEDIYACIIGWKSLIRFHYFSANVIYFICMFALIIFCVQTKLLLFANFLVIQIFAFSLVCILINLFFNSCFFNYLWSCFWYLEFYCKILFSSCRILPKTGNC